MAVTSRTLRAPRRDIPPVEPFAPRWARETVDWLEQQPSFWAAIAGFLAVLLLLLAALLLFGGGYATIQGVRIPLAWALGLFGYEMESGGLPPLAWWTLPALTNVVQIFARRIPGLRVLWWPSIVFDTATTALFGAVAVAVALVALGHLPAWWWWSVLVAAGAPLALAITLGAEKLLFGALHILHGAWSLGRE